MADSLPVWRIAGYLGVRARIDKEFVAPISAGLEMELQFGLDNGETRPLWRWLRAVDALLKDYRNEFHTDFVARLESVAQVLNGRSEVDPGGECKTLMRGILEKLRPASRPRKKSTIKERKK